MNLSSRRSPMGLKCRHLAGCNTLKQFTDQEQKCGCGGILWSDLRKFSYQEERERQIGTWNVGDICRRDGVARVDSISLFVLSVSRARGAFKCQASVCHVVARGVELHRYFWIGLVHACRSTCAYRAHEPIRFCRKTPVYRFKRDSGPC